MILDTTFLIDLYREARRRQEGSATAFLETHRDEPVYISVVTAGEFAEGFPPAQQDVCAEILRCYPWLEIAAPVAWKYAEVSRRLRARGDRIGDNDLWIAATALVHQYPLATRDVSHFARIEHLQLLTY